MLCTKNKIYKTLDWFTIGIYLILVLIGWFCIYTASYQYNSAANRFDISTRAGMQIIWILFSLIVAVIILIIDRSWYELYSSIIYIVSIFLLILTIFIAKPVKGSYSWIELGVIKIQPAEFAKFATALIVAKLLSSHQFNISKKQNIIILFCLVILPTLFIILQQEVGSALVFSAFFLVFYREGMSGKILFFGFSNILLSIIIIRYPIIVISGMSLGQLLGTGYIILCIVVFLLMYNYRIKLKHFKFLFYVVFVNTVMITIITVFTNVNFKWVTFFLLLFSLLYFLFLFIKNKIVVYLYISLYICISSFFLYSTDYILKNILKPHQKLRIQVALGVLKDPNGAGYNVNQSIIAIGAGGFTGRGYMKGTQTQLKYVPEQETDFIFCALGEEIGFIGSVLVLIFFSILIMRLIYLAEKQENIFARVYGYSVANIIFFHFTINVGMVLGIAPVIGIPLPFFSYGGSSLLSFTILLFIFLCLDTSKKKI